MSLSDFFSQLGLTPLYYIMILVIALGVYKLVKEWLPW